MQAVFMLKKEQAISLKIFPVPVHTCHYIKVTLKIWMLVGSRFWPDIQSVRVTNPISSV